MNRRVAMWLPMLVFAAAVAPILMGCGQAGVSIPQTSSERTDSSGQNVGSTCTLSVSGMT